ncbi:MAG: hypothetical protein E7673_07380 [Ruminococcaceae bacterium]|nr:hypothetical protein [Oscillospiraceae bacterium]
MSKFEYLEFFTLFKNFYYVTKWAVIPLYILLPLSFIYIVVLQVLMFVKHIFECLFSYIPNSKDEHIAYRITGMILFSFILFWKVLVCGALDACIYIFGFFYDLTNKVITLGKSENYFVKM